MNANSSWLYKYHKLWKVIAFFTAQCGLWPMLSLGWCTCSAESEAGPSLDRTTGDVLWVGALEGTSGRDSGVGAATGFASGVLFSGILCEMNGEWTAVQWRDKTPAGALPLVRYFLSPYSECGWETEHPDLSWGTPDHVSSGRRRRTPPPLGRESSERHRPTTGDHMAINRMLNKTVYWQQTKQEETKG